MGPFHVAFSLIRVPKLFISLLFWPMLTGFGIALAQLLISGTYFGLVTETPAQFEKRIASEDPGTRWLREMLFGVNEPLPPVQICRWHMAAGKEVPVDPTCLIKPYDICFQSTQPLKAEIGEYAEYFDGSTRTIHVCRSCSCDIVMRHNGKEIVSDVYGIEAMGVYMLSDMQSAIKLNLNYVNARETVEHYRNVEGTVNLHPEGFPAAINMTQATKIMILIINTAVIGIITLWLALKGHRKVLDYFARNGALLPLVAACGKKTFYASLWIITLLRVAFFLLAVIPSTTMVLSRTIPDDTLQLFIGNKPHFALWIIGVMASLSSLAIIASIAELKHRHSMVSFLYRYVPICLAFGGTALWFFCIFSKSTAHQYLHQAIAGLPVLGVSPMLMSPLFPLNSTIITLHTLFASTLVVLVLRLNSRWFAAHLEEL